MGELGTLTTYSLPSLVFNPQSPRFIAPPAPLPPLTGALSSANAFAHIADTIGSIPSEVLNARQQGYSMGMQRDLAERFKSGDQSVGFANGMYSVTPGAASEARLREANAVKAEAEARNMGIKSDFLDHLKSVPSDDDPAAIPIEAASPDASYVPPTPGGLSSPGTAQLGLGGISLDGTPMSSFPSTAAKAPAITAEQPTATAPFLTSLGKQLSADNGGRFEQFADRNIAGTNVKSRHATGEAIDYYPPDEKSGHETAQSLIDNGTASMVIYKGKIWTPGKGWHPYTGTDPHDEHLHIEADNAASRTLAQRQPDSAGGLSGLSLQNTSPLTQTASTALSDFTPSVVPDQSGLSAGGTPAAATGGDPGTLQLGLGGLSLAPTGISTSTAAPVASFAPTIPAPGAVAPIPANMPPAVDAAKNGLRRKPDGTLVNYLNGVATGVFDPFTLKIRPITAAQNPEMQVNRALASHGIAPQSATPEQRKAAMGAINDPITLTTGNELTQRRIASVDPSTGIKMSNSAAVKALRDDDVANGRLSEAQAKIADQQFKAYQGNHAVQKAQDGAMAMSNFLATAPDAIAHPNIANNIAIIDNFIRTQNPGATVRPQTMNMITGGQALLQRLTPEYLKGHFTEGQKLTTDFIKQAQTVMEEEVAAQAKQFDATVLNGFKSKLKSHNLPTDDFVNPYEQVGVSAKKEATAAKPATPATVFMRDKNGKMWSVPNDEKTIEAARAMGAKLPNE